MLFSISCLRLPAHPPDHRNHHPFLRRSPWDLSSPSATAPTIPDAPAISVAPSLTRLRFSDGNSGNDVSVEGLTTPIRFSIPALENAAAGTGAVCRFWDPLSQTFKGEGCASLPDRLPYGHAVNFSDLALAPQPAAALPRPASPKSGLTPQQQQAQAQAQQRQRSAKQEYMRLSQLLAAGSSCPAAEDLQSLSAAYRAAYRSPAASDADVPTGASPACAAALDAAGAAFFNASSLTPATAAQRISVAFDFTGDIFCGCSVTILDCAAENAKADAAARAARTTGKTDAEATAAADAALRKVHPSPRDALLIPAVSCPRNSTTIMKVYYGARFFYTLSVRRQ